MNVNLFLLFVLIPSLIAWDDEERFECEMLNNETCILGNVETTWENPKFKPITSRPINIKEVEIKSGRIPIFTNSICSAFNYVTRIKVSNLGIEKLDDNYGLGPINFCNNLEVLDLSSNNITAIYGQLFKSSGYTLTHLNLERNPLKEFPKDFFSSIKKLKEINLSGTNIPYFTFDDTTRDLKEIETIKLSHTPLLDLEIEKLIMHLPSLKAIHLRDTNILCTRLEQILELTSREGIKLDTSVNEIRPRDYVVQYTGEFECLNKDQWNFEVMKVRINDVISESKFDTLFELIKTNEMKVAKVDDQIKAINTNVEQYYIDTAYITSYVSFMSTTLVILLTIVSITSVCMCCKVRRYLEEERQSRQYRNVTQYQRNPVVDYNKNALYF